MILLDLLQHVLNAQINLCGESNEFCIGCNEGFGVCPGTTFHAIAAAFATQGYWVQADLLDMLTTTDFGILAPLLYVVAAMGGLIGVAIGAPPRNYMWFFLGPAIYAWLIDTRVEVTGVQWQVGMRQQDQREVWKLAEVGLLNTNMARRMEEFGIGHNISAVSEPENVFVANFFLWWDTLLSSAINGLVDWAGPYSMRLNRSVGGEDSNVGDVSWINGDVDPQADRWFLLRDLKWGILQDITSAKLSDPQLRDAFATFMGGLCGEALTTAIDPPLYAIAKTADGVNVPRTVFRTEFATGLPALPEPLSNQNMIALSRALQDVPVNYSQSSLQRLFTGDEGEIGSFESAVQWPANADELRGISDAGENIKCSHYLYLLILAMRWEAGHVYSQLVNNAPDISEDGFSDREDRAKRLVYNLFYGWNIKLERMPGPDGNPDPNTGRPFENEYQAEAFLIDLIFLHLVRNEMALVREPVDVRRSASSLARNYVDGYQRESGQQSKFGELYSWAILMPYLQGVLLYYLAMGYPFACLLMIVPGWHKSLFSWMSFWAWVKLWDVGFALVTSIERSVWAMIGTSAKTVGLSDRIVEMQQIGSTSVFESGCSIAGGCSLWQVNLTEQVPATAIGTPEVYDALGMLRNFRLFDYALSLGPSLDLDVANSYYIYIMAALFFAVPAVTGQLVLGARAGAASMVTGAIGQVTGEAGKAAGSGRVGDLNTRARANAASMDQAAKAGYLQKTGLAAQALEMGNQQTMLGIGGSYADAQKQGIQALTSAAQTYGQSFQSTSGAMKAHMSAGGAGMNQLPTALNQGGAAFREMAGTRASPTGSGATGAGKWMDTAGRAAQGFGAAGGFFTGPAAQWGIAGASRADNEVQQGVLEQQAAANIAQAGLGVQSFQNNSMASAYGRGAGIKQAEGQFGMAMAGFKMSSGFANQIANSSLGGVIQPLDPGRKPDDATGMALWGMAGSQAKSLASQFDPWGNPATGGGAMLQSVRGMGSSLNERYGSAAIRGQTSMPSYSDVYNAAKRNFAQMHKPNATTQDFTFPMAFGGSVNRDVEDFSVRARTGDSVAGTVLGTSSLQSIVKR